MLFGFVLVIILFDIIIFKIVTGDHFFTVFTLPDKTRKRQEGSTMPGICPRCEKNVYFAEEVKGLGNVYHKLCFSCSACRKLLDSGSITEHDNKMFCNSCYRSDRNSQSGPSNQNISFLGRTLGPRATDSGVGLGPCQWMTGMVTSPTPMLWITKPKPISRQRNPLCQAIPPRT